jgi:hypothetical protein
MWAVAYVLRTGKSLVAALFDAQLAARRMPVAVAVFTNQMRSVPARDCISADASVRFANQGHDAGYPQQRVTARLLTGWQCGAIVGLAVPQSLSSIARTSCCCVAIR